ncbi:MAG: nucleotide sugar dehydrogenase [Oligoflexia bacterium]|nr:nucleotide sugar dehydrogenase [Oligoflexia bacterium]
MTKQLKKMIVNENATIMDALDCCLSGAKKVCFCVDNKGKFLGLMTEGDFLRFFRNNGNIHDKVIEYINRDPVLAYESIPVQESKKLLNRVVQILPQLNSQGELVGYIDTSSNEYGFINIKNKSVTVLGLGYVGLTMGLVMADVSFQVKGVDINKKLIDRLKNKQATFYENGINDYINKYIGKRFNIYDRIEDAVSDIYIITVGTPVDSVSKEPKLASIIDVARTIGKVLTKDNLVILRSTVVVGTTRNIVIPELEKASNLKAGQDFYVAFCPERTAEGRALRELRELPQIVGGYDEKSLEMATRLFNEYTPTVVRTSNLETAEFCKLVDNCYRDVQFAFANQIAEVTEKIGINVHDVISAVNLNYDRNRISKPSPGVAGPCLVKDPYLLNSIFKQYGLSADLMLSARKINEHSAINIVYKADGYLKKVNKTIKNARVFIVGFAFKGEPETSDLRDSTTLFFLQELKKYTSNIIGYDPVAFEAELEGLDIEVTTDVERGFKDADVVFVMNNHRSYQHWEIDKYIKTMNRPGLIYDGWYLFAKRNQYLIENNILYASVGVSPV